MGQLISQRVYSPTGSMCDGRLRSNPKFGLASGTPRRLAVAVQDAFKKQVLRNQKNHISGAADGILGTSLTSQAYMSQACKAPNQAAFSS
jgi:hypothetical protein